MEELFFYCPKRFAGMDHLAFRPPILGLSPKQAIAPSYQEEATKKWIKLAEQFS
jgi:hypothetical protein